MRSGYAVSAPRRSLSDLQKELDKLSDEERDLLHNDIYGCTTGTIIESDELIKISLNEMDIIIQEIIITTTSSNNLPSSSSSSHGIDTATIQFYIRANEIVPDFVSDPILRLQFLRSELYNSKNAAIRFIKYWKERIWLWGEEKAFRKITIQDFDDEDQVALLLGGYQLCPSLDQFNRGILVSDRNKFDLRPTHRKSQLRQLWYILEVALENEQIQKNGIVGIPGIGLRRSSLLEQDRKYDYLAVKTITYSFPIRCVAIHHIVSSKMVQYVVPFLLYVLGSNLRKRYHCHIYSTSIFDVLQKYGIPRTSIPQDCGGTHPTYNYTEWLESRRLQNL